MHNDVRLGALFCDTLTVSKWFSVLVFIISLVSAIGKYIMTLTACTDCERVFKGRNGSRGSRSEVASLFEIDPPFAHNAIMLQSVLFY